MGIEKHFSVGLDRDAYRGYYFVSNNDLEASCIDISQFNNGGCGTLVANKPSILNTDGPTAFNLKYADFDNLEEKVKCLEKVLEKIL